MDVDTFGNVLQAASADPDLRAAIQPSLAPVELDSPLADQMKEGHELFKIGSQPLRVQTKVTVAERLSEILTTRNPDSFANIYWLAINNPPKPLNPAESLPGWFGFDPAVRPEILGAASSYLSTRPPAPEGAWWKDSRLTVGLEAGNCALRLLAVHSPASLDRLTDCDWEFWTPVILIDSASNDRTRSALLWTAYQHAKDIFLSTFSDAIEGENERHQQILVISEIGDLWSDELTGILHIKIASGSLTPKSFGQIIAKLLSVGDLNAKRIAQALATGTIPPEGAERRRAELATVELISCDPNEWSAIWPILQANEAFGINVLQQVAYERQYNSFATSLRERDIADLCIWLSKRGLDKTEKGLENHGFVTHSIALANWFTTLINSLIYRATPAACDAIRLLIDTLPQYGGLKQILSDAEEHMRRATWVPLAPADTIRIIAQGASPELVISIHGIRTGGAWQKAALNSELQKQHIRHESLDYNFFRAIELVLPWSRSRKIDWFRSEYERLITDTDNPPSIIAHSFGTYIIAGALEKYSEIRFDRIIFCGSIVRRDFNWNSLIEKGRVGALLNEYGGKDLWVRLAAWVISDGGASGAVGFNCAAPDIYQRFRPKFRHSDFFYRLNYTNNWTPFLLGCEPLKVTAEREPAVNWKFRLLIGSALLVLLVAAALLLIRMAR